MSKLQLGVIRDERYYRANNAQRERADAEYRARRPASMAAGKYRCIYCGHESQKHNECHHMDGNHANNAPDNHKVVDTLCHAYHHLGQRAASERFAADNLGDRTILAAIPEISAEDLNLLQRIAGVALLDPKEAPMAKQVLQTLAKRHRPVGEAFGTFLPGDFAAAMVRLDEEAYQHRGTTMGKLRMLFHEDFLRKQGEKFKDDYPALPVQTWERIAADAEVPGARGAA
ncbi:hypothetical protein [Ramlibacter sp. AN1133]|uniref:hypothetical protein n=1 Tax=Ramlibacter sp. AN1133 TaxID=3133429 RepID=UPI0030C024AE